MLRNKYKKLKIGIPEPIKTIDILNQITSDEKTDPFDILATYVEKHFYNHSLYGILKKRSGYLPHIDKKSDDEFDLYLYRKPNRSNPKKLTVKTSIGIDYRDEICIHHALDFNIEKLVLLKVNRDKVIDIIDFQRSIKSKKVSQSVPRNPYFHSHFIYISFMNTSKARSCYYGFERQLKQIKTQFQKNEDYTVDFILLNNPKAIMTALEREILAKNMINKLKNGKIYIILHAHASAGSNKLSGEYEDGTKWRITVDQIAEILKKFEITAHAFLDIDIFACEPGQYFADNPPFGSRLKQKLDPEFKNLSVKANVYSTYSNPAIVLSDSPRDVAIFGVQREPLSSKEQVLHSEVYNRILHLPMEKDSKSMRNILVTKMKENVKKLVSSIKYDDSFEWVVIQLEARLSDFLKFENSIEASLKKFDDWIAKNKIENPSQYEKIHQSLLQSIDKLYQKVSSDFDFEKSLKQFESIFIDHLYQLLLVRNVYNLKNYLNLKSKNQFFKAHISSYMSSIVKKAEREDITFNKAWDDLFNLLTQKKDVLQAKLKLS